MAPGLPFANEPPAGKKKGEVVEIGPALKRWLRSAFLESLKELQALTGTQPQKFEMRPVWGAKTLALHIV
jgi:hypothetical protein